LYLVCEYIPFNSLFYLIATDSDFDELCECEQVTYVNPIPAEKREKLTFIDG